MLMRWLVRFCTVCSHCMDVQLQPFVHYSWPSSCTRGRRVAGLHPNSLRVEAEYILDKSGLYCRTTWRQTTICARHCTSFWVANLELCAAGFLTGELTQTPGRVANSTWERPMRWGLNPQPSCWKATLTTVAPHSSHANFKLTSQ